MKMLLHLLSPTTPKAPRGAEQKGGDTGEDSVSHQDPVLQTLCPRRGILGQMDAFRTDVSKKAQGAWERWGGDSRSGLGCLGFNPNSEII